MGSNKHETDAITPTETYTDTAADKDAFINTCAMYGVIIAPNLAMPEQAPTPTDLNPVG